MTNEDPRQVLEIRDLPYLDVISFISHRWDFSRDNNYKRDARFGDFHSRRPGFGKCYLLEPIYGKETLQLHIF